MTAKGYKRPELPPQPLTVLGFGPQGKTDGGATIYVRFNQAVSALELSDEKKESYAPELTLLPNVAGRSYFQSPNQLVFAPEKELTPATRYKVSLKNPVIAMNGARYDSPLSFEFETPRPQVTLLESDPKTTDVSRTRPLLLHFDQETTLSEVTAHVKARTYLLSDAQKAARPMPVTVSEITQADAKRYEITWEESDKRHIFAVKPQPLWPGQSAVIVEVTPGLHSDVGPLPLDAAFSARFETIMPLKLVEKPCGKRPCPLEPITLQFNNPVPKNQLSRITVTPKPRDFSNEAVDEWEEKLGSKEVVLSGVFMPGTTYKITIPADLTDGYAQRLGQTLTYSVLFGRYPEFHLSSQHGTLRAGEKQTIGVVSRYVSALRVRAVKLQDRDLARLFLPDAPSEKDGEKKSIESEETRIAKYPWPGENGYAAIERTITLSPSGPTEWSSIALDLAELSQNLRGALLVEVSPTKLVSSAAKEALPEPARGLFRITDLGPVLVTSRPQSLMYVSRLSDMQPVRGARIFAQGKESPLELLGETDSDGILPLKGHEKTEGTAAQVIYVAQTKDAAGREDRAYIGSEKSERHLYRHSFEKKNPPPPLRPGERLIARLVTERDAYLPGERVRVVGWAVVDSPYSRSGLVRPAAGTSVHFVLRDGRGRDVAISDTKTTAEGKFWAELQIPPSGSLGSFNVSAVLLGETLSRRVKVEDFRVPEFSVTAAVASADIVAPSEHELLRPPLVRASASYYFGGAVPIRRASYHQSCYTTRYRPPGLPPEWTVGDDTYDSRGTNSPRNIDLDAQKNEAKAGRISFMPLPSEVVRGAPNRCQVDVQLGDASFQSYGARTEYQVHPARYYLAMLLPPYAEEEQRLSIPLRALSFDGKRALARGIGVTIERRFKVPVYRTEDGKKVYDRDEVQKETVRKSTLEIPADGKDVVVSLVPARAGEYEVTLRGGAADEARFAVTTGKFSVYVKPKHEVKPLPVLPRPKALELRLSAENAKPGDMLSVNLRAPWPNLRGVLLLSRNGLREQRPLRFESFSKTEDPAAHLELPIDDTWFPSVTVSALVVRPGSSGLPSVDTKGAQVSLAQDHRRLRVTVETQALANAGEKIPITVKVRDADDALLDAKKATRVALWAVDEAVLEMTGYKVPDLLPYFAPKERESPATYHEFESLLLPYRLEKDDPWISGFGSFSGRGFGAGGSGSAAGSLAGSRAGVPETRQKFEITPLFLADVPVEPSGEVKVMAKLPDNLTTFRITAIASARLVDGESPGRFGMNDARLRVTAPLIVRAAVPRLLRPGDVADAAAIVNNLGGPRGQLVVRAKLVESGPQSAKIVTPAEVTLPLAEGEVVRVPFSLSAERPGRPEIEFSATLVPATGGAGFADAVRVPLPVEVERALIERVAAYGSLNTDEPVAVPIRIPRDANPALGKLELAASTSLLGDLLPAARALIEYPYGCIEQTASRLLPLIALAQLPGKDPLKLGDVPAYAAAGVSRISSMQTDSGGFSYWPGESVANPYATAYALWVLELANRSGIAVSEQTLNNAADYLQHLLEPKEDQAERAESAQFPVDALDRIRATIAAHTLSEMGRKIPKTLEKLYSHRSELPPFARAFLLLALSAADPKDARTAMLTEELLGTITELPGSAHVVERLAFSLESIFYSEVRTDAIVLLSLLRTRPDSPVVQKLARGLLDKRSGTAWRNTQENAYALLALAEFAQKYESETPDLIARTWLGDSFLSEVALRGKVSTPERVEVPFAKLDALQKRKSDAANPLPVVLQRTGTGRLYYRLGLEWSPAAADPSPRAEGLRITRTLRDRKQELTPDAELSAGEPFAFALTLENRSLLYYVAVDIPLPAGLEAIQTNLNSGVRSIPFSGPQGEFVSHEEAWRDRVVLFANQLQPGKHHHTIYLRATTPGRYTLPPARAEAMYEPEIYGRSAGGFVVVK